jgi:hypothetical protein
MGQILLYGPTGMASKRSESEFNRDGFGEYEMAREKAALKINEELMAIIRTVWEELDQEMLNRMIAGSEERLAMVIRVRGRSISAYLSSHRSESITEDAAANQDFRPFSPEEEAVILTWVNLIGNRWKRISEIMAPRFGLGERVVIKHRAEMLMDNQTNLALVARTAISPEEEEASVQLEEAVVQLGEFFQGPPFPVE